MPPGATGGGRRHQRRGQPTEPRLPLVAPDLQMDVDDIVIGDGQPAQAVVDRERALLGEGSVVPHDARRVVEPGDAEGVGKAERSEFGGGAGTVGPAGLGDSDLVDRLTLADGNVPIRATEVAVEGERDALVDDQRAVGREADDDVRVRQGERLRLGGLRRDQRERRGDR
jgi:hypothetical protein